MPQIPMQLGARADQWDQQNVDLSSAGALLAAAPTTGFTTTVAGPADAFLAAWHGHLELLAADAEGFADSLRESLQAWLDSDASAGLGLAPVQERR